MRGIHIRKMHIYGYLRFRHFRMIDILSFGQIVSSLAIPRATSTHSLTSRVCGNNFLLREGVWWESSRFFDLKKMKVFWVFLERMENGAQWPMDLFERLHRCEVSNRSIFRYTSVIVSFLISIIEVYSINRTPRHTDPGGFYFYLDLAVSRSLNALQKGSIICFVLRIDFLLTNRSFLLDLLFRFLWQWGGWLSQIWLAKLIQYLR